MMIDMIVKEGRAYAVNPDEKNKQMHMVVNENSL